MLTVIIFRYGAQGLSAFNFIYTREFYDFPCEFEENKPYESVPLMTRLLLFFLDNSSTLMHPISVLFGSAAQRYLICADMRTF